jgi:hypothetical protein
MIFLPADAENQNGTIKRMDSGAQFIILPHLRVGNEVY